MGAVKRRRWQRKWEGWKENNGIGNKDMGEQSRGDVIMKISGRKEEKQRGWVEKTKRQRDKEFGDKMKKEKKNKGILGAEQSWYWRKESGDMGTQVGGGRLWGENRAGRRWRMEEREGEREMERRNRNRKTKQTEELWRSVAPYEQLLIFWRL